MSIARTELPTTERVRTPPSLLLGLAVASLVAQVLIVVTGGLVRLTGSGLGCPTWPQCVDASYVPTAAYGIHGIIEFGNRMLTFVLALVVLATMLAALLGGPLRRGIKPLAVALLLGIPAQAVLGGITVLTDLNPWVVMGHFMLSVLLIGCSTVLVARVRPPRMTAAGGPALRAYALVLLGLSVAVLYLGTVVTGSGPHAGDAGAHRTGLSPDRVSQLHADAVLLLFGLSIGLLVATRLLGAAPVVRTAALRVVVVELANGVIGFVQYFTGLPVVLVAAHMLGACLLVLSVVGLVLSCGTAVDSTSEREALRAG